MIRNPRFKVGCLMTLLIGFCLGIGFVFGILAHQGWKKKTEEPAFMKWAALKHLDKLNPSEAQRKQFETHVDQAVRDLVQLRTEASEKVWQIIDRAMLGVAAELTPEQQEIFKEIKPKPPEPPPTL